MAIHECRNERQLAINGAREDERQRIVSTDVSERWSQEGHGKFQKVHPQGAEAATKSPAERQKRS